MTHIMLTRCLSLGRTPLYSTLVANLPPAPPCVCCLFSPPPPPPCACCLFSPPPPPPPCDCCLFSPPLLRSVCCLISPPRPLPQWVTAASSRRPAAHAGSPLSMQPPWLPQLHVCCMLLTPITPPDRRVCIPLVLDAADVDAAAAEGVSISATVVLGVPPASTPRAAARPPAGGQAAARRGYHLLRRHSGAAHTPSCNVAGFPPSGGDGHPPPSLLLHHPSLTGVLPLSPPVPLCSLDGVSGRISSPHPGTPPTLLLSGGASTGGCSPPGEPLWQTAGGAAHPVGTRPEGWMVLPDVAGEPLLLHLSTSLPTLNLLSCLTT